MKNFKELIIVSVLVLSLFFSGCGKESSDEAENSESTSAEKLTVLNTKSEVANQMKSLADKYTQETGVPVEVLGVDAGADVQAMLKGYYLSDQMPDIISCEASGFSNWEGLLVDLSDQDWTNRTDAEFVDPTYGTLDRKSVV